MNTSHNELFLKIICWFITVIIFLWLAELYKAESIKLTPAEISNYIRGFGLTAGLVYLALYCLNIITVLPPIIIITMAAGIVFGFWFGAALLFTGTMIGTSITFFISRVLCRKQVERLLAGKFKEFDQRLAKNGFIALLFFRVVPSLPFEITNYLSGLTKIRFKDYFLATVIGAVIWSLVLAYCGAVIGKIDLIKKI